jgi:hypothetical protein
MNFQVITCIAIRPQRMEHGIWRNVEEMGKMDLEEGGEVEKMDVKLR